MQQRGALAVDKRLILDQDEVAKKSASIDRAEQEGAKAGVGDISHSLVTFEPANPKPGSNINQVQNLPREHQEAAELNSTGQQLKCTTARLSKPSGLQ